MAMDSKHKELSKVISDLRRKAGTSGIPTTFKSMQDVLLDTFQYEIPASDKLEKPRTTTKGGKNESEGK